MFFEQYSHEPSIAVARYWILSKQEKSKAQELSEKMRQGYEALSIMQTHLSTRKYFVGEL